MTSARRRVRVPPWPLSRQVLASFPLPLQGHRRFDLRIFTSRAPSQSTHHFTLIKAFFLFTFICSAHLSRDEP